MRTRLQVENPSRAAAVPRVWCVAEAQEMKEGKEQARALAGGSVG